MRKISMDAAAAFNAGKAFKRSNTEVEIFGGIVYLILFGYTIAKKIEGVVYIRHAGKQTKTTKERLNALDNVHIVQKDYIWYLNGQIMSYNWNEVGEV